ncbi:MAG: hypothetical protein H7210_00935, partial [Pyrinomonadaceae bacterium]|nr:hypothetical protein [Phycisphaerales bacterium]
MRFTVLACLSCSLLALSQGTSSAFEIRSRFVERIGNIDVTLANDSIVNDGLVRNIRLQFGVFDNDAGPAPAGGFAAWWNGSLSVSGSEAASDVRRNPGRLAPFDYSTRPNDNGNPPLPGGDPFTMLTEIVAGGGQIVPWICNPDGTPTPQPGPIVRGLNSFVSVYAFSIQGFTGEGFTVTAGGKVAGAVYWDERSGHPVPPDCSDPENPIPGFAAYVAIPTPIQTFTRTLNVVPIPAPASLIAVGGVAA